MITPRFISLFTVVAVYFLDRRENKHIKSLFDWVPAILPAYVIPALISVILSADSNRQRFTITAKIFLYPLPILP